MTREEAIKELSVTYLGDSERIIQAKKIAIKSLEKAPILDKIRAEIKAMFPPSGDWMYDEGYGHEHTVCEVLVDVLQIIDKYKAESEVRNEDNTSTR